MIHIKNKISLLQHKEVPLEQQHKYHEQKSVQNVEEAEDDEDTCTQDEGAAHKLWKQWAVESLGPLPSAPTDFDLSQRNARLSSLEKKCAAVAARAQKRLDTSAAIRQGWGGGLGAKVDLDGWKDVNGTDVIFKTGPQPGGFPREAAWTTHEQRKQAVYNIVHGAGVQERNGGAGSEDAKDAAQVDVHQPRSRALLNSMMAAATASRRGSDSGSGPRRRTGDGSEYGGGAIHWAPQPAAATPSRSPAKPPPRPSARRLFAGGPAMDARLMGILTSHARPRPQSALARGAPKRALSRPRDGGADGGAHRPRCQSAGRIQPNQHQSLRQAEMAAAHEAQAAALQERLEEVRGQLEDAQSMVQSHSELEIQLRDTIDLLRAKLHAQGAREQEQQRRLQQHGRLEPLFDRLAENFAFKSPEDVVARLEFLEDEKLSSLDELIRTQEEVTSLQKALADALKRVELTHSTLTTQHINTTARLSEANNNLQAEVQELEGVNRRLVDRQEALLSLQGAVIDLWGLCQEDDSFNKAVQPDNSKDGVGAAGPASSAAAGAKPGSAQAEGGGLSLANPGDPLNILAMVKEFLVAKSPQLASKQYLELQKVANNVWMQHFQHKERMQGRVAETFEALSNLADIMAAKIRTIQDQLKNSVQGSKRLEEDLARLKVQKRALQVSLGRRDELVRQMSGVPRRERPHSAATYHTMARKDEVTNWSPTSGLAKASHAPTLQASPDGNTAAAASGATATPPKPLRMRPRSAHPCSPYAPHATAPAAASGAPHAASLTASCSSSGGSQPGARRLSRPGSAPLGHLHSHHSSSLSPYEQPLPLPPQLFRYPQSSSMMSGYQGPLTPKISDKPAGSHWDVLAAAAKAPLTTSRPSSARAGGLFNTPYHAASPRASLSSAPFPARPAPTPGSAQHAAAAAAAAIVNAPHWVGDIGAKEDMIGLAGLHEYGPGGMPSLQHAAFHPSAVDSLSTEGHVGAGGGRSGGSQGEGTGEGGTLGQADSKSGAAAATTAAAAAAAAPALSQSAAVQALMQQQREQELARELAQPRWQRRKHQQQEQGSSGAEEAAQPSSCAGCGAQQQPASVAAPAAAAAGVGRGGEQAAADGGGMQDDSRGDQRALRWIPPSRSAIEASFLTRLERAASAKR